MKTTSLLKIQKRIAADERGGIMDRWLYGRQILDFKVGRKQLPHGLLDALIKDAERVGTKLTRVEIQRRIRFAEAYETEAKVRRLATHFEGWWDLVTEGFPPLEDDVLDPDELAASGLATAPDEWEQMEIDIPGLKPVISIRGRKVELVHGESGASVADVAAYLDMCEQMHESFEKTVEHIRESLRTMREHADSDEANALEAWEAATRDDEPSDA